MGKVAEFALMVGLWGVIAVQAHSLITRNVEMIPDVGVVIEMVNHAGYEEWRK